MTSLSAECDPEVRLRDIATAIWNRRLLFCAVSGSFLIAAIAYAIVATPWYRAEVLLLPAERDQNASVAGRLSGLGSLVGLTGIGLGKSDSTEAIALLGAKGFTAEFIQDENLLTVLFADQWDKTSGMWLDDDPARHPDVRDGIRYFSNRVRSISLDPQTGLVTLAIEWTNADQAADWANLLVTRLNEHMRQQALIEAQENLTYLEEELEKSSIAPLRQSISNLLETELQKVMLANGDDEYAFRVIDSAQVPKRPVRPRKLMVVILGALFGITAATLLVMAFPSRASRRARTLASQ